MAEDYVITYMKETKRDFSVNFDISWNKNDENFDIYGNKNDENFDIYGNKNDENFDKKITNLLYFK